MKKLLLLSALLIFACSSDLFAQDYMKMRKKQLRIEHQKKLKLIDSLSQELNLSNNENLKIKLEIDKNDISMQKLSEQNKELNEENNKLKEDVLFYEKMLGKRRK